MPLPADILGILFALTSAAVWGSGDFTGGQATRKSSQYAVLVLSAFSGLAVLVIATLVSREHLPSLPSVGWATLSGASGALGIAAFYRALSRGPNVVIAPITAVIGAALTVVFGAIALGLPSPAQMAGFGLAFAGIWLVSSAKADGMSVSREGWLLTVLAGMGFGGFFIFMGQVETGKVFTPLICARSMTLCTGLLLLLFNRQRLPAPLLSPLALLAGVLDAGGNLFYILARQYTRLDIAAVLSSLYPLSTVILASLILKEKVTRGQWLGVLACLGAIALITV
ncbi:MAG TPA: DMT family transporter [Anaerolineaceae bacterium]|jgi:drug/metabolite transporter (DMT)-like permease